MSDEMYHAAYKLDKKPEKMWGISAGTPYPDDGSEQQVLADVDSGYGDGYGPIPNVIDGFGDGPDPVTAEHTRVTPRTGLSPLAAGTAMGAVVAASWPNKR
ncbi:MAG TPA: hypothetical protein VF261_01200 [Candidatus Saccharimonadales bacterium]